MKKILVVVAFTLGSVFGVAATAGALTKSQLKAKQLSISNMPAGWAVDNSSSGSSSLSGCFAALKAIQNTKGITRVTASYVMGNFPDLGETLITGKNASHHYTQFVHILNGCKQVNLTSSNGTKLSGSVGAMSFPTVGDSSNAYSVTLSANGINVGFDIVLFRVGQIDGDITYADLGSPDLPTVEAFATAAVQKINGQKVTTPTTY